MELKAAGFPLLELVPVHLSLSFLHVAPCTAQVLPQKHGLFKSAGVESFNFKSAFGQAKGKSPLRFSCVLKPSSNFLVSKERVECLKASF